ncbi:hypothetical protein DFH09DRAFT_1127096 [Mycena vulgaris]|nr:hypothetical protein DFH09DRAFT_1127096 [Mycena vulgaris]
MCILFVFSPLLSALLSRSSGAILARESMGGGFRAEVRPRSSCERAFCHWEPSLLLIFLSSVLPFRRCGIPQRRTFNRQVPSPFHRRLYRY